MEQGCLTGVLSRAALAARPVGERCMIEAHVFSGA